MIKKNTVIVTILVEYVKTIPKLYKSFNFSNKKQKYKLETYLEEILFILKTGIAWRDLRSHINWNSVYKVFIKLNEFNVFASCYLSLFNEYIKNSSTKKLRYILTDTSFIPNKYGHDVIGYNRFYNRKNGTKISIITDSYGVPLDVMCCAGNLHDSKILLNQFEKSNIVQYIHDCKHNCYFLADPAYDTKIIRDVLFETKYTTIIPQNKRNIKDKKKIIKLSNKEKKLYNKRMKVENTFNKLKTNRRLLNRYDSKIESFKGFLYLALIKVIC